MKEKLDYIHNAEFDDVENDAKILGPMPDEVAFFEKMHSMRTPKDVDPEMAYLYRKPLLTREQEAHLFRKMNYLKHKRHKNATVELSEAVNAVRDLLIECNQRLVHSLATKAARKKPHSAQLTWDECNTHDELKSDVNISVMNAVEKFDYSRGYKFGTYATWAVRMNMYKSNAVETIRRARYVPVGDLVYGFFAKPSEYESLADADAAKARVNMLLEQLNSRTREIIQMRCGLLGDKAMTLAEVGKAFGITKERVRQINLNGIEKIRKWAAEAEQQ